MLTIIEHQQHVVKALNQQYYNPMQYHGLYLCTKRIKNINASEIYLWFAYGIYDIFLECIENDIINLSHDLMYR